MKVFRVLRNEYRDSLYLMKLSSDVSHWPQVHQAVIVMGTDSNLRILKQVGLHSEVIREATPNDLIIAVELDVGADEPGFHANLDRRLRQPDRVETLGSHHPSLEAALESSPDIALVSISTPGEFAADQARQALQAGKHVFCFSHHIPVEVEIELKNLAIKNHLLMLGPDCGTAILDGIGLGFANQVRRGSIGVVSASGSGLQEVTSLIHRAGGGISQAIGVGGRDLVSPVDGRMAEEALRWTAIHPDTKVIILLAKKVSPTAQEKILTVAEQIGLPIIVQFQGGLSFHRQGEQTAPIWTAKTYEECAELGILLGGYPRVVPPADQLTGDWIETMLNQMPAERKAIRGLFAGGSLCAEAAQILTERGIRVETNLAGPIEAWQGPHRLIDLGAEEYTEGRAHPFIDHRLRSVEIGAAFADPSVGVLLADVVLGWGCHEDPAGEFVAAVKQARDQYEPGPMVIASVCGTSGDPQGYERQCHALENSGIFVARSNAAAARLAADCICRLNQNDNSQSSVMGIEGDRIFKSPSTMVNIGLPLFEAGPRNCGVQVLPVHWRPGPKISAEVKTLLDELL